MGGAAAKMTSQLSSSKTLSKSSMLANMEFSGTKTVFLLVPLVPEVWTMYVSGLHFKHGYDRKYQAILKAVIYKF